MPFDQEQLLTVIDGVLSGYSAPRDDNQEEMNRAGTVILAAVQRYGAPGSAYVAQAESLVKGGKHFMHRRLVQMLRGILQAMRDDVAAGRLRSITEMLHADVFTDFLEQAEYLLNEGFKEAAAVLMRGVLEEHVRQLCDKNSISVRKPDGKPKKVDTMNAELVKANAYDKGDQKNVTAWYDLGTKAAHGKHEKYEQEQVAITVTAVRDFITRHPA